MSTVITLAVALLAMVGLVGGLALRRHFSPGVILALARKDLERGGVLAAETRVGRAVKLLQARGERGRRELLGEAYLLLARLHLRTDPKRSEKEFLNALATGIPFEVPDFDFLIPRLAAASDRSPLAVRAYLGYVKATASTPLLRDKGVLSRIRAVASVPESTPPTNSAELKSFNLSLLETDPSLLWPRLNLGILAIWDTQPLEAARRFESLPSGESDSASALPWLHLARGLAAHDNGRHEEAVDHFREAVKSAPQLPLALANLGLAVLERSLRPAPAASSADQTPRREDVVSGITHLTRACEIWSGNPSWWVSLGNAHLGLSAFRPACAAFNSALQVDPACLQALLGKARALKLGGQPHEALGILVDEQWEKAPSDILPLRAELLFECGRTAEAIDAFRLAADVVGSQEPRVFSSWASALLALGQWSEIHVGLRQHLEGAVEGKILLARALAADGHAEEAITIYESIRAECTGWASEHYEACARSRIGDWEGARRCLDRALAFDEHHAGSHRQRAIVRANSGDQAGAVEDAKASMLLAPSDSAGLYLLGALQIASDPAEAANTLRQVLQLDPGHVQALVALARLAEAEGNTVESRTLLKTASTLPGASDTVSAEFGCLLARVGDDTVAVDCLEPLSRRNALDPTGQYLLGLSLARLGRHEDATAIWDPLITSGVLVETHEGQLRFQAACAHYEAAKSLSEKGNLDGASAHLRAYMGVYGDDDATGRRLASILGAQVARTLANEGVRDLDQAASWLKEALELAPDDRQLCYYDVLVAYRQGDLARARRRVEGLFIPTANGSTRDVALPSRHVVELLHVLVSSNGVPAEGEMESLEALARDGSPVAPAAQVALARRLVGLGDYGRAGEKLVQLLRSGDNP